MNPSEIRVYVVLFLLQILIVIWAIVDLGKDKPIRVEIVNPKPIPMSVDVKCIELPEVGKETK